ncbi:MAG TPA: hypothetical protein DCQ58_08085, partial [Saprospirales bacterium]|nr:hypothetical protein [Saprospirales bacterium]
MIPIAFIDTEIDPKTKKILDIGSTRNNGDSFHNASVLAFISFIKGAGYVCGHNILNHDIKYIGHALNEAGISQANIIDTL